MEESCKDNELEDGECSDQDDDGMINYDLVKQPENQGSAPTHNAGGLYRHSCIPQIVINSDQSDQDDSEDDDDDDDYHERDKKSFRYSNTVDNPYATNSAFVNPLRAPGMAEALAEGASKKRRNNVWGAVMTEQILAQDIKQFGVNAPLAVSNRDVESYDFKLAKEDDRPDIEIQTDAVEEREDIFGEVVDLEKEVKKQNNRKRKRNVKDRLGARNEHHHHQQHQRGERKRLCPLDVTENDDPAKVTQAIIEGLEEQNLILFGRIMEAIGNEKAIQLYNKTVDVESVGGMMTHNGFRRRTPGGVYIQLLKTEPSISEEVISAVFEQENQKWMERKKELRKIKKAARKKFKKKGKQANHMDFDRPETPTPTKELEELDNLDNGNEGEANVDVSDLPDRPDTPEPKDSSDNVSAEEDDDEEEEVDIAVAIAKAKAAILKKQKEMVMATETGNQSGSGRIVDESVEMT